MSEIGASAANQDGNAIDALAEEIDPNEFATAIASADEQQLKENMKSEYGELILAGIFHRFPDRIDPNRTRDTEAVIEFRIRRSRDALDVYQVMIEKGKCRTVKGSELEPRVTFELGAVDFLRLISGVASGPMMFITGKLKIRGDVMFAATAPSLFVIPKAG